MKTVRTKQELEEQLFFYRTTGSSIGFVPTMGALHQGHVELMNCSRKENNAVVVSIFVNPTQFNNPNDLRNYPRTVEQDLRKCEQAGVDLVFLPEVEEMYPTPDNRIFDFGILDKVMEGKHRPGHFNGVAQIVSKLFDAVKPTKAYFGQKDFQQLAIIKKMVSDLKYEVDIIAYPTIREVDGLAMSSRNLLLSSEQRASAPLIAKTLLEARNQKEKLNVFETKEWVIMTINNDPQLRVEYFEISNSKTLEPLQSWLDTSSVVGCIAVQVGSVRLIDNIMF